MFFSVMGEEEVLWDFDIIFSLVFSVAELRKWNEILVYFFSVVGVEEVLMFLIGCWLNFSQKLTE